MTTFKYPKNRTLNIKNSLMEVFEDLKVEYDGVKIEAKTDSEEPNYIKFDITIPERLTKDEIKLFYDQDIGHKIDQLQSVYGIICEPPTIWVRIGIIHQTYKSITYYRSTDDTYIHLRFKRY